MRKYLFLLMMAVTVSAQAQRMVKTQVLKSTDLGNQKLEVAIEKSDTPRTKWQRKGQKYVEKYLRGIVSADCATAIVMDMFRQASEIVHPVSFQSGGIINETKEA